MPTKLYVSDLDGTLLNEAAELTRTSRDLLAQMLDQGLLFTVASARSVYSIRTILGDLPLKLPVIEYNGSYISDCRTGHHHVINSIDPTLARDVYDYIHECSGLSPFVSSFNGSHDLCSYEKIVGKAMQSQYDEMLRMGDERLRQVPDIAAVFDERTVSITAMGEEEPIAELYAQVSAVFGDSLQLLFYPTFHNPPWYWLSVHDKRASKDAAIRTLKDMCGLDHCEVTVFGDHVNDLGMFSMAHRAVATDNAIPEVKALAHHVIGRSEHDSVARFISEEWCREKSGLE